MYLIEILHQTTTGGRRTIQPGGLYLIEILHQTTTSQPVDRRVVRCILSKFYIKPQPSRNGKWTSIGCILSKFYIKPQLFHLSVHRCIVVSYRNSTSNHNLRPSILAPRLLYLIEILHQTTTIRHSTASPPVLYLIEILHQTTTVDKAF